MKAAWMRLSLIKWFRLMATGTASFFASCALAENSPSPQKVACVGDSITFGATIQKRKENCYPAQLGRMLGDGFEVRNFGVNGATMLKKGDRPYWGLKKFKQAQNFAPDVVVIKLGTNDTKPHNWAHKSEYVSDYVELVQLFQNLPSKPKVWICYPIPVFPENWGINDKTIREEVIPMVDEVSKKTGAKVIDLHAALKGKAGLVPDQVHPNAEGATLIAETVKSAISEKVYK